MEIDRKKVEKILIEQQNRVEELRGEQPLLTLSCFYGREVDNDDICKRCRKYAGCYLTLKAFAVEEKPFERAIENSDN